MGWLFLLLAVASEAVSHVALKATDGLSHLIPNVIVITGHLGAFYFLSQAMKTLPDGVAHASWAGLAIVAAGATGALLVIMVLAAAVIVTVRAIVVACWEQFQKTLFPNFRYLLQIVYVLQIFLGFD